MSSSRPRSISAAVLPLIYVHSRRGQRIPGISVAVLSLNHVISSQTEVVKFWNFLEFVLKNGKIFQPGSEVVNIWIFLEFVLKNGKFFQPGSEVVEFRNFMEFLLKNRKNIAPHPAVSVLQFCH